MTALPALPARAAYLFINNAPKRNSLSLAVLRDLRTQLIKANTCPQTGRLLLLPPFKPAILSKLERCADSLSTSTKSSPSPPHEQPRQSNPSPKNDTLPLAEQEQEQDYTWLVSSRAFATARSNLPSVLVLASDGPVFSSGHDLRELHSLAPSEVKETFALCAEVMTLLRRSPTPVVGRIQGLATAAGAQLALSADLPIALPGTEGGKRGFKLPGASLGLPCTSPSTVVSRRVGDARGFRMMALAETWGAEELGGAVEVVKGSSVAELDERVLAVVNSLAEMPAQPAALGKWAYWTQAGLRGQDWVGPMDGKGRADAFEEREGSGGDGYEDAVGWAGRMMALYARSSEDAREGMSAFMEKRKPVWVSHGDISGGVAKAKL